jgi:secondary thiamine-phosphate synthase enzyme
MTCPPFWTISFRPAAITVMSRRGMTATDIHLQATLLGPSLVVPISDGRLVLATWQQILHLECDVRGRERTIVVSVIGDERQSTRN